MNHIARLSPHHPMSALLENETGMSVENRSARLSEAAVQIEKPFRIYTVMRKSYQSNHHAGFRNARDNHPYLGSEHRRPSRPKT